MTTRETPLSDELLPLLAELKRGGELIFENAQQLRNEARLLAQNGAFARSACLHQLSNEECGKIDIVGGWAMSIVLGSSVDVARVAKALNDHKAKNYANAYFSLVTEEERNARNQRDWLQATDVFRRQQAEIHRRFNTQKNAALYVNFKDGIFSGPKDVITEALAEEMAALNDYFLGLAANHVRLIGKFGVKRLGGARCRPAPRRTTRTTQGRATRRPGRSVSHCHARNVRRSFG